MAKLGNRCFCWFPSAMLVLIGIGTSMESPYKSPLILWKHFFWYLLYEIFLWPESWWGSLYIYLLSLPRFWTLSIEQFWFLLWSTCILNGVTPKTSNSRVNCLKTIHFTAAHTFIAHIWQYIQPPPPPTPLHPVLTTHLSVCSTFIIRSIACVPTSTRNFWMQHKKMLRK